MFPGTYLVVSKDIADIEFVWGWVGWYAKSFSCLTQLMLSQAEVEFWLTLGFDNKFVVTAIMTKLVIIL